MPIKINTNAHAPNMDDGRRRANFNELKPLLKEKCAILCPSPVSMLRAELLFLLCYFEGERKAKQKKIQTNKMKTKFWLNKLMLAGWLADWLAGAQINI